MELNSQETPGYVKSRVVELDARENPGCQEQGGGAGLSREQEQGGGAELSREPRMSRAGRWSWTLERTQDVKSREVELDSGENPGCVKQGDGAGLT